MSKETPFNNLFRPISETTAYFLFNLFDGMTETEVQAKEEVLREYLNQLSKMVCFLFVTNGGPALILNGVGHIITTLSATSFFFLFVFYLDVSTVVNESVQCCLHLVFAEHHHSCEHLQRNQEHPQLVPRARAN